MRIVQSELGPGRLSSNDGASGSSSLSVSLVPEYPVLMTLPLDAHFANFHVLTIATVDGRMSGLVYHSLLYEEYDVPYLKFQLQSGAGHLGLPIRVSNNQLVIPE